MNDDTPTTHSDAASRAEFWPAVERRLGLPLGADPRERARRLAAFVKANPRQPMVQYLLGVALQQRGEGAAAARHMRRALDLGLADPAARFQYATVLVALGRDAEAEKQLLEALARKPDFVDALRLLGQVLHKQGRLPQAIARYRELIGRDPASWSAWFNLGQALFAHAEHAAAIEAFSRAIGIDHDRADGHASLAVVLEVEGRTEDAERAAAAALAIAPGHGDGSLVLAKLHARRGAASTALSILDAASARDVTQQTAFMLENERGHALDAMARYDDAFAAYDRSKRMQRDCTGARLDRSVLEVDLRRTERWLAATGADAIAGLSVERDTRVPRPIFVLGFPRTGTTLMERMLAGHHAIVAGGELEWLKEIEDELADAERKPWPEWLQRRSPGVVAKRLAEMRTRYLDRLAQRFAQGGQRWVVDKHPLNARRLLLLGLLFPDCHVIRMVRHPLDTVLSNYFQNFASTSEWSFEMADIAWYLAAIDRYIAAVSAVLPVHVMDVRYEALVDTPERIARDVLDRVGEPWDPACLNFHQRQETARTASYAQVTRPLYSDAKFRYKHYLRHIDQGTIEMLRPMMDRFGYDIDP